MSFAFEQRFCRTLSLKTSKRHRWAIFCGLIFLAFFLVYKSISSGSVEDDWWRHPAPCETSPYLRSALLDLLNITMKTLQDHNLKPFICYGTLWGAIRYQSLLQFDRDIDVCVVVKPTESIEYVSELLETQNILVQPDENVGAIDILYHQAMGGVILFTERDGNIFRLNKTKTSRGIPKYLIEPLRKMKVGSRTFDAPDPLIQQYLFPDTYETEVRPPNCPVPFAPAMKKPF